MGVIDTHPAIATMVHARHLALSPEERMRAAAEMFEVARLIIDASLPPDLSAIERRLAFAKRMYGDELPEDALLAHAHWPNQP